VYDFEWDLETNGILLTGAPPESPRPVRPVFCEELDLLGLQRFWRYPRCREPLLWAIGRRYYWQGQEVAQTQGGGFFREPQLMVSQTDLVLEPVDITSMVAKNAQLMRGLEHEAIGFIDRTYHEKAGRHQIAAVAFSGGKDSLVVLDLMQRALPPDVFSVIFDDTTMELEVTYKAVERARRRWPNLRFYTARSRMPASETWRKFGPPSRIHRWCCSVHKSAPTILLLRELARAHF